MSSVCVVTNALRLRFFKPKETSPEQESRQETEGRESTDRISDPAEKQAKKEDKEGEVKMKKIMKVNGMMCPHCQAHVTKALADIPGVASVEVSLENKEAVMELSEEVPDETLMAAVKEAGYEPLGVEQG